MFSSVIDEAGLRRLAPDARGRLDVFGGGLGLALHDHQSEPPNVETDRDHVGGERDIDGVLVPGRIAETRARLRNLVGRVARRQLLDFA